MLGILEAPTVWEGAGTYLHIMTMGGPASAPAIWPTRHDIDGRSYGAVRMVLRCLPAETTSLLLTCPGMGRGGCDCSP